MGLENDCLRLTDHIACGSSRVDHQAGIALLRHRRGNIGVVSAFLQQDPRTRLRILNGNILNESAHVQCNARCNGCQFDGFIHGLHLTGIVGIGHRPGETQIIGHALTIQRPARSVQNGGAHRTVIEALIKVADFFQIAREGCLIAHKVVRIRIGLSRYAVGVVRNDRCLIVFGERIQNFHCVGERL